MIDDVKPGLNECYLVPHGNIRMEAMGLENRLPNDEELERMCAVTRREMEAGAVGLSTGLIYMPCAYSESREIIEMCKVVAEYDGLFVIHQRSEADTILDSMEEVIKIGRESGVRFTTPISRYAVKRTGIRLIRLSSFWKRLRRRASVFPSSSTLCGRKHDAGCNPSSMGA